MQVIHHRAPASLSVRGLAVLVALIACWWPAFATAQTFTGSTPYTYSIIDIPGAQRTLAKGVNNLGQITGNYTDASGTHVFLLSNPPFNPFLQIDNPGIVRDTRATGINNLGEIVGIFDIDPNPANTQFLAFQDANLVFDPIALGSGETYILGINDLHEKAGYWTDSSSTTLHSFVISDQVIPISNFNVFGGLNNAGDVLGRWLPTGALGVYNYNEDTFVPLPAFPAGFDGVPTGINNAGQIVGTYQQQPPPPPPFPPPPPGPPLGFVLSGNTYTTVALTGASSTTPIGINDFGQIAGYFADANGNFHGFLATPKGSNIPITPTGFIAGTGGFQFHLSVVDASPIVLDPLIAVGYEFVTSGGPNFQSVLLPAIGASTYEIDVWNGSQYVFYQHLAPGVTLSLGATGVSRFRVLGIDASAALDPANPLAFPATVSFVTGGEVNVTMTPITVPEPTGVVLTAAAASMTVVARSRRCRAGRKRDLPAL